MDDCGLLGPRLNIVHSVWITREEMDRTRRGRCRHRAQSAQQHEAEKRHRAALRHARGRRAARARLRQLQRHRRAKRVPGDEDVVPDRGGERSRARRRRLAHEVLRHATLGNARTAGLGELPRRHQAGLQGRPDPHRSQRRRLSAVQQRGAAARLYRGRPRRGQRDGRWPPRRRERVVKTIDKEALRREVAG